MRMKVTLVAPGGSRDIAILCDVTATVGDAARALIRAGAVDDPHLQTVARHRLAPVTLRGRAGGAARDGHGYALLDPCSPIGASGLQSGWSIEPVAEFGVHRSTPRMIEAAGCVEVLSGPQAGAVYSLVRGENTIGRDPRARIHLHDGSVSRRHAAIVIGAETVLRDAGSANGTLVDGRAVTRHVVVGVCTAEVGDVVLRITPGAPSAPTPELSHRVPHMRAPRVEPRFRSSTRELPAPPAPSAPARVPMLAMLAPMMMGGAMYAITGSPMSLMMVAFSPLMMIGAWFDGRLLGRRRDRGEALRFERELEIERKELRRLRATEAEIRDSEAPSLATTATAINDRTTSLWTRRPEHRSFLEIRFGEGVLPSRTGLALPPRSESPPEHWRALLDLEREFRDVGSVPVLEHFERSGSIGIAGERGRAEGLTRALVLQLAGLHSPAELSLVCFAGPDQGREWGWLKWLPHVDGASHPIPSRQLVDDAPGSLRLITALEGLLETRRRDLSASTVRSRLDRGAHDDDPHGEGVRRLPVTPAVVVLVLDDGQVEAARLIALAEHGPDVGIHLLWLARERSSIPAACRTFVALEPSGSRAGFVREGREVELLRPEYVDAPVALGLSRRLAPVEDAGARVTDESDLPRTVALSELHHTDLLGGGRPILQAWAATGTLVSRWRAGERRAPAALVATVGQGADGPVSIDLRAHGPHALVGGTTGSGKSEFLQSWIMSLAATISPERVNFLLRNSPKPRQGSSIVAAARVCRQA
ncbi:FHA domain-containing protein [Leucobacter sp. CSA1]|uniref:FHA domain-containing protein n=1 Tax=Leucobacter chromiisoli TaxID=2796471 RepID=A0A934UWC7_9MICO|nr:FtsK/SpoIIIE domain-containing protein [Leucobacter chromiisoli]MBK0420396.1 FHA domain-containing protein [Leucobacter chromiisoli]